MVYVLSYAVFAFAHSVVSDDSAIEQFFHRVSKSFFVSTWLPAFPPSSGRVCILQKYTPDGRLEASNLMS